MLPNKEGELLVKGENMMKGYYKLPEETAKTIKESWLYTGDIAKIGEDGYIYITQDPHRQNSKKGIEERK